MEESAIAIYNISKKTGFTTIIKILDDGLLKLIELLLTTQKDSKILISVCKSLKTILKKELYVRVEIGNSEDKPFTNILEKSGVDKYIRDLLVHNDSKVSYYTDIVVDILDKQ